MYKIRVIQKNILTESEALEFPRFLKSFTFNKKNKKIFKLNQLNKQFFNNGLEFKIYLLNDAPQLLQRRFLKYFNAKNKIDKLLLGKVNNFFIIDVEVKEKGTLFWNNKIVADNFLFFNVHGGGSMEFIEKQNSDDGYMGQAVTIYLKENTKTSYTLITKKQKNTFHLYYRSFVTRHANFVWQLAINNASYLSISINNNAIAKKANIKQIIGTKMHKRSKLYLTCVNNHRATHTVGDIMFKGLATGMVESIIDGMIRIDKRAQFTDSYLQSDSLLLDDQAKVITIPQLEILNNEVKASHGSTVGKLDKKAIFYLTSRGLKENQAKKLLLISFMNSIITKVENKKIRKEFQKYLL